MRVRELASNATVTVGPGHTLRDAAKLMHKHRVGSAVVQDGELLAGIITLLAPSFLLWRVVVVSLLFAAVSLGMFFAALGLGRDLETARTIVVNALVVLQVFYLFNVRYLHMPSLTLRGALGTPAVLWALVAIVAAQLLLTYAPIMQHWFATRSLSLVDGAVVIACGAAFMFLLEAEKLVLRRFGFLEKPPSGTPVPGPSRAG